MNIDYFVFTLSSSNEKNEWNIKEVNINVF